VGLSIVAAEGKQVTGEKGKITVHLSSTNLIYAQKHREGQKKERIHAQEKYELQGSNLIGEGNQQLTGAKAQPGISERFVTTIQRKQEKSPRKAVRMFAGNITLLRGLRVGKETTL